MAKYIRLNDGLTNYKLIPAQDNVWDYIENSDKDWYTSIYQYNDEHYKHWKATNSVAGIKDPTTNKLVFDFDGENPEDARQDAVKLTNKLLSLGILEKDIQIAFSGNKGFHVSLDTKSTFTPEEFKSITRQLAEDLDTYDSVVTDPQRVFRLVGTRHNKSGLYKKPLTAKQLSEFDISKIKTIAASVEQSDIELVNTWSEVVLPESILKLKEIKKVEKKEVINQIDIDLKKKPRFLDVPRWYLQNGYFGSGERHNAFLCLAATYKNLSFELEHTYRLLKGVAEIQSERNNVERYSDVELFRVVKSVYDDTWEGGQFSLKDENSWLYKYAKKYNIKLEDATKPMTMSELGGQSFTKYAKSFYETRIYTGLKDLDEAFPICAGSNVAIVGAASSGKTAISLNILRESNKQGMISVFASLDMARSRLYEKMLYSVTKGKKTRDEIYMDYINGKSEYYDNLVKEAFPNTYIFSKSSPTVDELKSYIEDVQEHTGKSVRLLMIDYFERLGSDKSDDTAASKDVAGNIQDLIAEFPELTPITLYQPNKFALGGGPDKPILNYSSIKGSSFIYQSARQILSLWRPMFTPELKDDDKYIEMAILKNDLGELGKFCYNWDGKTGTVSPMSDYDNDDYEACMKKKAALEKKNNGDDEL